MNVWLAVVGLAVPLAFGDCSLKYRYMLISVCIPSLANDDSFGLLLEAIRRQRGGAGVDCRGAGKRSALTRPGRGSWQILASVIFTPGASTRLLVASR